MSSTRAIDENLTNLLAEARAFHFTMLHNAIPRQEAERKIEPMLQRLNQSGKQIAKKYKRKYVPITLQDLGKSF